ncbi:MAG TPA: hypothetical protein VGC13_09580 [Longimicrobium sp.]|jgi:hypothetical protein|uniref:hypothetical protein n=1 Tax=Longimicrobium sp. TaxID=2029185 RepID=UPI002ED9DFC6
MPRRYDDLQPEELPEVLREAVRLQEVDEREREVRLNRESYAQAAEEMGISRVELDRAAAETHAATVTRIRRGRRIRNTVAGAAVAVLAAAGAYRVANPPPPEPAAYTFQNDAQVWSGDFNARSTGSARQEGGRGVIVVERFVAEDDGRYWANLNTASVPASLEGHETVTLRIRGDGGLGEARVFIENGPTERWRSPPIPVEAEWRTIQLRMDQFEHQTRPDSRAPWRSTRGGDPDAVTGVSLKVGHPFNPTDARGRVEVDDLRIE